MVFLSPFFSNVTCASNRKSRAKSKRTFVTQSCNIGHVMDSYDLEQSVSNLFRKVLTQAQNIIEQGD